MNIYQQVGITAIVATYSATAAIAADTEYKFESDYLSNQSTFQIPGLDISTASASSFTLVVDDPLTNPSPDVIKEIKNFKLEFENAPSLLVSSLKKVQYSPMYCPSNNVFYGTVNNTWIFRTIEVTLCANYLPNMPIADFNYMITVKDNDSYNSNMPVPSVLELAEGSGTALDKTPNKIADTLRTTVLDKTLRMNLLQRPAEALIPNVGPKFGFVINAAWLGFGDQPLVIDLPAAENVTAIALVIEVIPGPTPETDMSMISVIYKDSMGTQSQTPPTDLRYLLEQSYGPLP